MVQNKSISTLIGLSYAIYVINNDVLETSEFMKGVLGSPICHPKPGFLRVLRLELKPEY